MGLSAGRPAFCWAAFAIVCLAVALLFFADAPAARAWQENPPGDGAAESAPAAGTDTAPRQNLFKHMAVSAGPFFGLLLLTVSLALVTLIVLLSMDLRMPVAIPPAFVEEFTDTVNKRKFREAFELARNDGSFLGKVLTVGMGRLQYGIDDAREAAFNTVDSLRASKDQLITYLATIGTLGPMLGLVGTVYGMIIAFMELGQPGKTPNPARLADGISHALVVTLLGVALSVPAIFCHAFFTNRLKRITMDVSNIADDLLTQMYHNSRKPASASTAPTADAKAPVTAAVKAAE